LRALERAPVFLSVAQRVLRQMLRLQLVAHTGAYKCLIFKRLSAPYFFLQQRNSKIRSPSFGSLTGFGAFSSSQKLRQT
jgi:hypothetical protein